MGWRCTLACGCEVDCLNLPATHYEADNDSDDENNLKQLHNVYFISMFRYWGQKRLLSRFCTSLLIIEIYTKFIFLIFIF